MKVLIADDHLVVRKGLIQIIKDEFPDAVFSESIDGKESITKLRNETFDIAIIDITMPEPNGIEVLKQSKLEGIQTPILILTTHPEDQYAIRVIKAGASGFIGKEQAGEELTKAIHKILAGRKYISETLAEQLATGLSIDTPVSKHGLLSNREFDVLKLIAQGKSVSEIGVLLNLSTNTISTYRSRILIKTQLKNNAELMRYAIINNLV